MLFKNYLQWHLNVQKLILLPNYCLPKGKFRTVVFCVRILWLVWVNISSIYDLQFASYFIRNYIDVGVVGNILGIIDVIFFRLGILTLDIIAISKNHCHVEFIEEVHRFEEDMDSHIDAVKIYRNFIKRYFDIFLIVMWVVFCNLAFMFFRLTNDPNINIITWYIRVIIEECIQCFVIFYIIAFIDLISQYMTILIKNFENSSEEINLEKLYLIEKIYNLLKTLEKLFVHMIVYFLLYHSCAATFTIYYILRRHLGHHFTIFRIYLATFALIALIRSAYYAFSFAFRCNKIHEKMEKLTRIVANVDFITTSHTIRLAIKQICMGRLHERSKITAWGFYSIDLTVFTQVSASIVTFILIIIQFKQLEDQQKGTI
uniref:Gustatory receptor n=1 Tax=Lutzomyia longipalpis TaxID=7200 RepID=A0A3F2ZD91_LUTLO